jgi:hypothetical protein
LLPLEGIKIIELAMRLSQLTKNIISESLEVGIAAIEELRIESLISRLPKMFG